MNRNEEKRLNALVDCVHYDGRNLRELSFVNIILLCFVEFLEDFHSYSRFTGTEKRNSYSLMSSCVNIPKG